MINVADLPLWRLARTSDPHTSKDAARRSRETGAAQRAKILDALAIAPGTADELDQRCGFRPTTAGRRIRELAEAGLIQTDHSTRPTRSGRSAEVWGLTRKEAAA